MSQRRIGGRDWIDLLAGYRYLRFQERLGIQQFQSFTDPDPMFPRTGTIAIEDSFSTWSEFHGAELGIATYVNRGAVSLEMLAKVAIGNVHKSEPRSTAANQLQQLLFQKS